MDIQGLEIRGSLTLGALSDRMSDLFLEGAVAYADGDSDDGAPVDSTDPTNLVLGLRWSPSNLPMESELIWTWSDDKDAEDISSDRMPTDSYNLFDLLVHYDLSDTWSLDAGVFNLFDEKYIRWADTVSIGTDAPDRFTRPGRNFSVTLRARL